MKLSSNSRYIIIKVAAIRRLPVILLPLVMFLSMAFVPGKASALSVESFALDSIAACENFRASVSGSIAGATNFSTPTIPHMCKAPESGGM